MVVVQFKENMIYELFKNRCLGYRQKFFLEIKKLFSIDNETIGNIYRRIINYQIETYGRELRTGIGGTYVRGFKNKSSNNRRTRDYRNRLNSETNKIIERNSVI